MLRARRPVRVRHGKFQLSQTLPPRVTLKNSKSALKKTATTTADILHLNCQQDECRGPSASQRQVTMPSGRTV